MSEVVKTSISVEDMVYWGDPQTGLGWPSINWRAIRGIGDETAEALDLFLKEVDEQEPGWEERGIQAKQAFEAAAGFTVGDIVQEARKKGRINMPDRKEYWDRYWVNALALSG